MLVRGLKMMLGGPPRFHSHVRAKLVARVHSTRHAIMHFDADSPVHLSIELDDVKSLRVQLINVGFSHT